MTAQTEKAYRNRSLGDEQAYKTIANEIIYQGCLVTIKNSSGLAFANDGVTNTLSLADKFAGVTKLTTDNSKGGDGEENVMVYNEGVYDFDHVTGGLTQANIGDEVYLNNNSGDGAVDGATASVNIKVGRIVEVLSATKCRVRIDGYAGHSIAA